MLKEIKQALLFTVVTMALLGGAYPVALWGVGAALFPSQAEGSLVRNGDGTVVGSTLIAQRFARPEYFQPRPSAVDYDAASTGGSNYGPSNGDHLKAVRERLDAATARDGATPAQVPSEMVTASGAGLDPHISPAAALLQSARVARARGVPAGRVEALVAAHAEGPALGVFGRPRVNVLALNLALDAALGPPSPASAAPSAGAK